MKKIKLIAVIIMFTIITNAQNCKFKTNEVDKFTGKFTKITKSRLVIQTGSKLGIMAYCSTSRVDTTYSFIFSYEIQSFSKFEPYSINKGASLMFILENGEIISLKSADSIKGTQSKILLTKICKLENVNYPTTKNQMDSFLKSKVKTIRFYRTEGNGKENFVDYEIVGFNQDDIQDEVKCIL